MNASGPVSSSDPGASAPRGRRSLGITQRTALLAWLISIVTLLIFTLAIVPEQKRAFREHLRSKALGIAVSLHDVAAGAAVSEDYGSVVDHCVQMLNGDPSLDYLVLTRNDGFSLVHDRDGWRSTALPREWRPPERVASGALEFVPLFQREVYRFSQPFDYSGIEWGWIHIGLNLDGYHQHVHDVYLRTGLLAVICLLFGLGASILYAKHLVRPILALQSVVRRVASGTLTARAPADRTDELGQLAASINAMTEALVRRDRTLQETNETLEQRVLDRTRELEAQVAEKERAHRELAEAQHRLIQLSREAGMAEVATGVLHNVGNVLNSVNVSANVLRDTLARSELPQLRRAADLLAAQAGDLPAFFTHDPRARHLPQFLHDLAEQLGADHQRLATEIAGLTRNIEHIKEVVGTQQSLARAAAVIEHVDPAEVFQHALGIQRPALERHHVRVHRDFAMDSPVVATDRHNLLQILTNFVANAVNAVAPNPPDRRELTARLASRGGNCLVFTVADNGVGIPAEHRPLLFQLGFTTRKNGHGFGLHAAALAARALGGSIEFTSDGPGTGAVFSLVLPLQPASALNPIDS